MGKFGFFSLLLLDILIFVFVVFTGLSLRDFANIYIIETLCILGFFILGFTAYKIYKIFDKKQKIFESFLLVLGNIILCSVVYGFILFGTYFIVNSEIIQEKSTLSAMFFGELLTYTIPIIILLVFYSTDFIKTMYRIKQIEYQHWFFLRPHIRILIIWFAILASVKFNNILIMFSIKLVLDGIYYLFNDFNRQKKSIY